jgi:hypothetical protein
MIQISTLQPVPGLSTGWLWGTRGEFACPKDLDTKTKMEVFHLMRLAKIDSGSGGSAHS